MKISIPAECSLLEGSDYLQVDTIGYGSTYLHWQGEQSVLLSPDGMNVGRLAGGFSPLFPRRRYLRFIRSPFRWKVALQANTKAGWQSLCYCCGQGMRALRSHDGTIYSIKGEPLGSFGFSLRNSGMIIRDGSGCEIGWIQFNFFSDYVVFSAGRPICVIKSPGQERKRHKLNYRTYRRIGPVVGGDEIIDFRLLVAVLVNDFLGFGIGSDDILTNEVVRGRSYKGHIEVTSKAPMQTGKE